MRMDNSGDGPLRVPGLGGIPIDYEIPSEERFAHSLDGWCQVPGVTIRERALVAAINMITDKPGWHVDVFDDARAQRWRAEAEAAYPKFNGGDWPEELAERQWMNDKTWAWCLLEVRAKAAIFEHKKYVRVLDTGSCICKSDVLIAESCAQDLKSELAMNYNLPNGDMTSLKSNGVFYVVDPDMYPMIYGKTEVLQDGLAVSCDDLFGNCNRVRLAEEIENENPSVRVGWSTKFQRLPCEVEFREHGHIKTRISSYINNLHPRHTVLYTAVETIISQSIPLWNESLVKGLRDLSIDVNETNLELIARREDLTPKTYRYKNDQRQSGRVPLRIVSYGIPSRVRMPEWALNFDGNPYKEAVKSYRKAKATLRRIPEDTKSRALRKARDNAKILIGEWPRKSGWRTRPTKRIPAPTLEQWQMAEQFLTSPELGSQALPDDWKDNAYELMHSRVTKIQQDWDYPSPGDVVTFEDWSLHRNTHRPVVARAEKVHKANHKIDERYAPTEALHLPYTVQLEEQFRDRGLQVIVKIGGIEKSCETNGEASTTGRSGWQTAGSLNEHVVATAVYVYEMTNFQSCRLEFRQNSSASHACYRYLPRREGYPPQWSGPEWTISEWMRPITEREDLVQSLRAMQHSDTLDDHESIDSAFSRVGEISMPAGRLIAFPNVMDYRWMPSQVIDPSLPACCRFVTLDLVDPNYRICSTRNVPPQQHEWWRDAVEDLLVEALPAEIATQIAQETAGWPMSESQAQEYRQEMLSADYGLSKSRVDL